MGRMGAGVRNFVNLDDTPGSFSGQAGKYSKVNAGEDALEFATVAAGGISEGDYDAWAFEWINALPQGLDDPCDAGFFIDDKNDVLEITWEDEDNYNSRSGIFNLSDFSSVFTSPTPGDYLYAAPMMDNPEGSRLGNIYFYYGGSSRSLQTYMLLLRNNQYDIEVWRGASSVLWSHNIRDDVPPSWTYVYARVGAISITGKYILIVQADYDDHNQLMLYKGATTQDSGAAIGITETSFTDNSKNWTDDEWLNKWVLVTSGDAEWKMAKITHNTATAIFCSAASFVTWGMTSGDTYKIVG